MIVEDLIKKLQELDQNVETITTSSSFMAKTSNRIKDLSEYIQITRKNIKTGLGIGDHFFVIESVGKQYEVKARGVIRPRLKKGWITVETDAHGVSTIASHTFRCDNEETVAEYHNNVFGPLFNLIDQGVVYKKKTITTKSRYTLR